MKKRLIPLILLFIVLILVGAFVVRYYVQSHSLGQSFLNPTEILFQTEDPVEKIITDRKNERENISEDPNPFDKDGKIKILLVGLDKRVGQKHGHCDVIQFVSIDQKKEEIHITAVPRGTYSPLPPGKGATSSDYYVSNACGLGGLEYGIKQIEKILGQKADYLVVVGFSETMGILRLFDLPTTETLQWLRRRQTYAIGEPQRAHNHSTFLKTMMTKYLPTETSKFDTAMRYVAYKIVQTDLTFDQALVVADAMGKMDLEKRPDRVQLSMKPVFPVQDIPYDPEHLNIRPGADTVESIQKKLLDMIKQKKNDVEFILWAFENDVWLQVEDEAKRESIRYDIFEKYLKGIEDKKKREELIADYVLEMQHLQKNDWMEKGKELLQKEIGPTTTTSSTL